MILLYSPLRMFADPLGDIGLCSHDALHERAPPRKLQALLLTAIRLRDCANQNDDAY